MNIAAEKPLGKDAPYVTTLTAEKFGLKRLIEAQSHLDYSTSLKAFMNWLAAKRLHAELYIAIPSSATIPAYALKEIKTDGVGILILEEDGSVSVYMEARNPSLVVTPDPTLKYGDCRAEVESCVKKFNEVNRKDGLRDMCDIVERETKNTLIFAARKKMTKMDEETIEKKIDWSTRINALASPNTYNSPHSPIITAALKEDLHSFRGSRNLIDHPPKGKRQQANIQKQFTERMAQGPRLVSELISARSRIQRRST
jgi:hypothetical protein